MKLLLASLALTVFAGSQAFVLRDEPDYKLPELIALGLTDVYTAIENFNRNRETVEQSEIGRVVRPLIDSRRTKLEERRKALLDSVPNEAKEAYNRISEALRDVFIKVADSLRALDQKVTREKEAFYEAVQHDLNPALERLDPHIQTARERIVQAGAELDEKLVNWPLEKLQPLAEGIQSRAQGATETLEPIADEAQAYILAEVEKARDVVQRASAHVLRVLDKYKESFNQWLQSPSVFSEAH